MSRGTLMVIAKEPVAGVVKTRLCPPCTPVQAAALADATLRDTLAAVAGARTPRRLVVLEGAAREWLAPTFEVTPQRGAGLGQRLAAAFDTCGGAGFLVAMDTPQLTPALLDRALDQLEDPGIDAVVGPTSDGGYWGIGFAVPRSGAFAGVPMSATTTLARQLERLAELGLRTALLEELDDVDTISDARAVADAAPHTRFAAVLAGVEAQATRPTASSP
ncbi:MAG: TIGR04282 family arsenosugar biosynthesis glycosyltransferase [Thermoleophilaceae bacterium]